MTVRLTTLDLPESLRGSNQSFSELISSWNNEFFQIVAADGEETDKLLRMKQMLLLKRPYLDISYQKPDYVSYLLTLISKEKLSYLILFNTVVS